MCREINITESEWKVMEALRAIFRDEKLVRSLDRIR